MSALELAVLGALTAAYLEAKNLITEDLSVLYAIIKTSYIQAVNEREGLTNFSYRIMEWADTKPDSVALVYPRMIANEASKDAHGSFDHLFELEVYTFRQLYDTMLKYAHVLKYEYGVKPGDIVGIDCMNIPEYIFIWFALWSIGSTPAHINYNLKGDAVVYSLSTSGAKLIFVDPEVADNVPNKDAESKAGAKVVYIDKNLKSKVDLAPPYEGTYEDRLTNSKFTDCAMLIYTSGTTGMPKPAIISWKKCNSARRYSCQLQLKPTDVLYTCMPLYHSTAGILGLLTTWHFGATFALGKKFSASTFWTQAKLCNATYVQYVGEACRFLLNTPEGPDDRAHKVRVAAGNGLRQDIWSKFKDRFHISTISEFYSATEFPTVTTNLQHGEYGVGSVLKYGTILTNILLKSRYAIAAVDLDSGDIWRDPKTGLSRRTKAGEPGEFLFRIQDAKNVINDFQGYHGNKRATNEKVIYNVFQKGDAYIRTGDMLYLDKERLGYFVDRMGDTFRWKSENVATNEVEEVINSFNGIVQSVVVGVKVPNHEGRAGFAIVVPEVVPDMRELARHLNSKLPSYALPLFIKFTEKLESTGTHKVQKVQYRNQNLLSKDEAIYFYRNGTYVLLDDRLWIDISSGKAKL